MFYCVNSVVLLLGASRLFPLWDSYEWCRCVQHPWMCLWMLMRTYDWTGTAGSHHVYTISLRNAAEQLSQAVVAKHPPRQWTEVPIAVCARGEASLSTVS